MGVDFDDFFNGGGFEEDGGDAFLDTENDTFGSADADGSGAELAVSWMAFKGEAGDGGMEL